MYEFFEHTADLGLRATANDLNELFAHMATAMMAAIVEPVTSIMPMERRELSITGQALDDLLFDWLRALLYWADGEHWLCAKYQVVVGANGLVAEVWGEPLDRTRHELFHEVKAITYHELCVEQTAKGWLAEVIVDI